LLTYDDIKSKHLLIDADIILHRCCWAAHPLPKNGEKQVNYGFDRVREFIDESFGSLVGHGESYEAWFSAPHSFREIISVTQPYKGHRKNKPKPLYFKEGKDYIIEQYGAQIARGIEADDAIGQALTVDPVGRCACSIDSDFLQVSGFHYNFVKHQARWVSRKAGDFHLYTKLLQGDSGDNIPGIRGIGPKKAKEVLKGSRSSKELCRRAWLEYRSHDLSRDYFIEQARLVYILRSGTDILPVPFLLESTYEEP